MRVSVNLIYVRIYVYFLFTFLILFYTLTLFACVHQIRDGWLLFFSYANDFIVMLFILFATGRPFEIKA